MIKVVEIAVSMLIFISGIKIGELNKPSILEIHLLNGDVSHVKIHKQNSYSCPINCAIIHHHDALITKNVRNNLNYNISYLDDNKGLKLNNKDVIDIFELQENKKNKKNKRHFKRTKIDIQSFVKKYNL